MKKILLSLCTLHFVLCTFAFANPSPVVQVVSYREPLGMYFSLQGWGSGSIIDNQGHILTNNHVVDDGLGGISRDFAICVTTDPATPPVCHYTASVIARDPERDVALLQIDALDIFGTPVNYSSFGTLSPDYSYAPLAGDPVLARGYPWVGANTITQTQGVISGTSLYNGKTYIKTDTLIAGGNSGGPLIRNDRLIGVNTFLIGGYSDPALGYSLLISEVRDFIEKNINATQKIQKNNPLFASFLLGSNTTHQTQSLMDPLVTFKFPQKYFVTTHIPGVYLDGQVSQESSTAVYGFSFLQVATPRLRTPEDIRFFLSQQSFFPFGDDVKFTSIILGGQAWYSVDTLGSTTGDKTKTQYVYFRIVDQKHLLLLQLLTPSSNETTYEVIQGNIRDFLSGISFPAQMDFGGDHVVDIADASLGLNITHDTLVDYRAQLISYGGIITQLMGNYEDIFSLRTYLDGLWSYAQISIVPNSFYTQNTSARELLDRLNENNYFSDNIDSELVTYRGYDGFISCNRGDYYTLQDEKGSTRTTITCEALFLVGEKNSHILSLTYLTDIKNKSKIRTLMQSYLDAKIVAPTSGLGSGETDFGTKTSSFHYNDVDNQSPLFQETLSRLVSYGILSDRPSFEGDTPLNWSQYIRLHVWTMYHRRLEDTIRPGDKTSPTFAEIIETLPIDMNAYVDSAQRSDFELMFRMRLAGVTLPEYSPYSLSLFQSLATSRYSSEWKQIEAFEYLYFGGKKIGLNGGSPGTYDMGYFSGEKYFTYHPLSGISESPVYSRDTIKFDSSRTVTPDIETQIKCSESSRLYFSVYCFQQRQEYLLAFASYNVLSKGDAISLLLQNMDFALWDAAFAKKKQVTIEGQS